MRETIVHRPLVPGSDTDRGRDEPAHRPAGREEDRAAGGRVRRKQLLVRWTPFLAAAVVLGGVALAVSTRFAAAPPIDLALTGRVIVLPLVNATGDRAEDWVSLGLAEMITDALERTPGVSVVRPERLYKVIASRGLEIADEADRERGRELALALGAELVVDATLDRRGGSTAAAAGENVYRLRFRLFGADGEVARGEVAAGRPLAAADLLAGDLARGLVVDAEPVSIANVFSRSSFVDRLYAMGLHQLRTSGAAAAAPYFEIALSSRPRFLQGQARLAECRQELGDAAGSRQLTLAVLDEAQARGEWRWQVWSLQALGRMAALQGGFDEAQEHASRAFSIALDRADLADRGSLLFDLARVALARDEKARAEELFVEILEIRQNLGDSLGEIDVLLEIGSLFLGADDLEGARQVLARARQLAAGLDDLWTEMRAVSSLGEVARRQGDHALAGELWSQALSFYEERGDRDRQLLLARNLAEVLLLARDFEAAEQRLRRVLDLASELENPAYEAAASLRLTWILLRTGYPRQARTHLDRALALDRWLSHERLELQQVIAWFAYEQGNYQLAVDTQQEVKRQAAERWSPWQEEFLEVFEKALASGRRWPVPGEDAYRRSAPG